MGSSFPPDLLCNQAGVAELVDAPGLGPGGRKPLEVQVLSPALTRASAPICVDARSSASLVNSIGVAFGTSCTGASRSSEPPAAFSAYRTGISWQTTRTHSNGSASNER